MAGADSVAGRVVVSVVVPMLDEAGFINDCLSGFSAQTWPLQQLDVIVVDGGSTDGSREIVANWAARCPWVRIIANPDHKAAAAFNRGVEAARGDIICLFSAHGVPDPSYVERSVHALQVTGADGVGGRYSHRGRDPRSKAIGLAMTSPFGMASPHRYSDRRGPVDTISHPAYRRESLLDVGPFNEALDRNSDYELNWRMRAAGKVLMFDPSVVSTYRPRETLARLARQFWWYGKGKAHVARGHPGSVKLRHLVAPVFTIFLACAVPLACTRLGRRLVVGIGGLYVTLAGGAVLYARPRSNEADITTLAAAFPVMHACWGAGFVTELARSVVAR